MQIDEALSAIANRGADDRAAQLFEALLQSDKYYAFARRGLSSDVRATLSNASMASLEQQLRLNAAGLGCVMIQVGEWLEQQKHAQPPAATQPPTRIHSATLESALKYIIAEHSESEQCSAECKGIKREVLAAPAAQELVCTSVKELRSNQASISNVTEIVFTLASAFYRAGKMVGYDQGMSEGLGMEKANANE